MHGTDLLFAEAPRGSAADGRSSRSSPLSSEDLTLDDSLTASFNDALAAAFGTEALKKRRLSEMGPWADRRYFSAFLCIPESKRVLRALLRLSDDESCFSISACGELTLEKQGNPIQSAGWEAALEYRSLDGSRYVKEGGFVHFPFAKARLRLEGPDPDRPCLCTGNMFASHAVAAEFYLPLKREVYLYRLTPPPPDIVDRLNPPPPPPRRIRIPKAAVADGHGRHARFQLVRHVCVAVAGAADADAESRAVGSNRRCQRQRDARGRRP
ncbi:hypothetical protein DFJ73DRAFT_832504 [Zopfochytrium polystomum]|nr:hypothetical protein DFJ73DRAFT_832504 [Zopfochytrium polystomum]